MLADSISRRAEAERARNGRPSYDRDAHRDGEERQRRRFVRECQVADFALDETQLFLDYAYDTRSLRAFFSLLASW